MRADLTKPEMEVMTAVLGVLDGGATAATMCALGSQRADWVPCDTTSNVGAVVQRSKPGI